jgi:hypothetical protein
MTIANGTAIKSKGLIEVHLFPRKIHYLPGETFQVAPQ